jgi:hypothetical protein
LVLVLRFRFAMGRWHWGRGRGCGIWSSGRVSIRGRWWLRYRERRFEGVIASRKSIWRDLQWIEVVSERHAYTDGLQVEEQACGLQHACRRGGSYMRAAS